MELINTFTYFLVALTILLVIVLLISFIFSRLKKEDDEDYSQDLIARNPQTQAGLPRAIEVIPARPRKIRSQDTQIYYLNKLRNTTNNYRSPATPGGHTYSGEAKATGTNGVHYTNNGQFNARKPNNRRYTIVNNQLRGSQENYRDDANKKDDSNYNQVSFYGR